MQTWQTFIQIGPLIFLQLAPAIIPISAELIGRALDRHDARAERRAVARRNAAPAMTKVIPVQSAYADLRESA